MLKGNAISRQDASQESFFDRPEFINVANVRYGPPEVLGLFFLFADSILKELGIRLYVSSLAELAEVQSAQSSSWPLFAPMLDPRLGGIDAEMSYGFIGVDRSGRIACSQGGRVYSSTSRSLAEMIDDQSFFYGEGRRGEDTQPKCSCTAPVASRVIGTFTYSGALWVHPDHRGHQLAALLPRLSRAYALTRWNSEFTIAVVSDQIAASPLMRMYAYRTVQREFRIENVGPKPYVGQLMVLTAGELIEDLERVLSDSSSQIDPAVSDGRTEYQAAAVAKR